jgi:hypothetical protein
LTEKKCDPTRKKCGLIRKKCGKQEKNKDLTRADGNLDVNLPHMPLQINDGGFSETATLALRYGI